MCIRDKGFGDTFFSLHGRINVMRSQGEGRETLKLLMCHKIDLHLIHAILVMMYSISFSKGVTDLNTPTKLEN